MTKKEQIVHWTQGKVIPIAFCIIAMPLFILSALCLKWSMEYRVRAAHIKIHTTHDQAPTNSHLKPGHKLHFRGDSFYSIGNYRR